MKKSRPTFHILTIFPEMCASYLNEAILKRAQIKGVISCAVHNLRDYTTGTHRKADDRPYGGGPGMVMYALPILKAVKKIVKRLETKGDKKEKSKIKIIITTPGGKQFSNELAIAWAKKYRDFIFIAGRYEGIDARVKKALKGEWKGQADIEEVSIGPFVLTGGELPALTMTDAICRQIEGVLGNEFSREEKRTASAEMYTRPEVLAWAKKKYPVPKVLLSGHHQKIEEWKAIKKRKKVVSP